MFRSQTVLDQIVDDIACMLDVPRRNLHVVATSKGCVVGDLKFTDADGSIVNSEQDISVTIANSWNYCHAYCSRSLILLLIFKHKNQVNVLKFVSSMVEQDCSWFLNPMMQV